MAVPPVSPVKVPSQKKPRRLAWLVVVALMAWGWFWVIKPRPHPPHPTVNWEVNPSVNVVPNGYASTRFDYRGDEDVADALFQLLRPDRVSIKVGRNGRDGVSVTGTLDEINSIKALLDAVGDRSYVNRSDLQLRTYALPPDQADAMKEILETAGRRIHVEDKRGTLRVRAPRAVHDAIGRVIQHLNINTMTDISSQKSTY